MITQRGKMLLGIIAIFLIVCAYALLAYNQYVQQKQINSLVQPKVVTEMKTVIVTPTVELTATPAAKLKITPVTRVSTAAKATNIPTKGIK